MSHPAADNLDLLAHFADVLEGGNAHAGGNEYEGIPGVYSNDPLILAASDDLQFTVVTGGSTTALDTAEVWADGLWAPAYGPPYFAYCVTSSVTANLGKMRKITAWDNATATFTTRAWPAAVGASDTFRIYEGFALLPDAHDINTLDAEDIDVGGHDRFFSLAFDTEGLDRDRRGASVATRQTELIVTLRLLHYDRQERIKKSIMMNAALIREAILHESNRTGTNLRGVVPGGRTAILTVDERKYLVEIRIPVIYRMSTDF